MMRAGRSARRRGALKHSLNLSGIKIYKNSGNEHP
jgi:hypothetical protein